MIRVLRSTIFFAIVVAISSAAFAATATTRARLELPVSSCPTVLSGDESGAIAQTRTIWDENWAYFDDPVPFGGIVTRIEATLWGYDWWGGGSALVDMALAERHTWGQTVHAPLLAPFQTLWIAGFTQCGSAAPGTTMPAWPTQTATFSTGIPGYVYATSAVSGRNYIRIWSTAIEFEAIELKIHYEPPPTIAFDLTEASPDAERRVLIHRWREESDYSYPSSFQRQLPGTSNADRDGKVLISGFVRRANGTPVPKQTIYLRIVDPPDDVSRAPYVNNLAHGGDNSAFLSGMISPPTVMSDDNGRFQAVLQGSAVAGDNYRVQASTVPNFSYSSACSAANNCYSTGVLTMWKRVYLEYDRMFRAGSFISSPAVANQNRIENLSNEARYRQGDTISVIHASRAGEPEGNYYREEAIIADVIENRPNDTATLILQAPLRNTYVPASPAYLGDAVGIIRRQNRPDCYDLRLDYARALFDTAYVEYVPLLDRDNPSPYLPYIETLYAATAKPLAEMWRSSKVASTTGAWSALPNHQHLLAGSEMVTAVEQGETLVDAGINYSWIWVDRVEGGGYANPAQWRKIGEHVAHELGHQWHSNQDKRQAFGSAHCDPFRRYHNDANFCTMHSKADSSEFHDGRVAFHYVVAPNGVVDSEYVFIRRRTEPIPQFPNVVP